MSLLFISQNKKKKKDGKYRKPQLKWIERDFICILGNKGFDEYQIQEFISMIFNYHLSKSRIRLTVEKGVEHFKLGALTPEQAKKLHKENIKLINSFIKQYKSDRQDALNQMLLVKKEAFLQLKHRVEAEKMTDTLLLKTYQTLFDHSRLLANEPTQIHKYENLTDEQLQEEIDRIEKGETLYFGRAKAEENRREGALLETSFETANRIKKPQEKKVNTWRES